MLKLDGEMEGDTPSLQQARREGKESYKRGGGRGHKVANTVSLMPNIEVEGNDGQRGESCADRM